MRGFETELGVLKKVKHMHIVELIGSYTDARYVALIMSPVADGDLADFLAQRPISSSQQTYLRKFFGCLSSALTYLHDSKIRHKDLKPRNILVKEETVLLTDFGLALDWTDAQSTTFATLTGFTRKYCAPEVAREEPRSSSSDVWSLGCVFLEMLTVLKGVTVDSMDTFLSTHGSESKQVWNNPAGASLWMARLRLATGLSSDNAPITWIQAMLQQNRRERPSAKTVFEWTKDMRLKSYPHVSFCGNCCCGDDMLLDDDDDGDIAERHSRRPNRFAGASSVDTNLSFEGGARIESMQLDTRPPDAKLGDSSAISDNFRARVSDIRHPHGRESASEVNIYFGVTLTNVRVHSAFCGIWRLTIVAQARYFILKSTHDVDIESSIAHGVWISSQKVNTILDKAFQTDGLVILFFSVIKR